MRRVRLRVQVVGAARLSSWRARAGTARLAIPTSSSLLRRGAGWRPEFRTFRRSPSGGSPASGSGVSTLPRSSAAPPSPYVDLLRALQAAVARHRLLTAVTIVAEAGDLYRFRSASAFHGLRRPSAQRALQWRPAAARPCHQDRQKAAPAGSGRDRPLRSPPAGGQRGAKAPPAGGGSGAVEISWRRQQRLHHKYRSSEDGSDGSGGSVPPLGS